MSADFEMRGASPYKKFLTLGPQFADEGDTSERLYHGTFRDIEGGVVRPARETSHNTINFDGLSHDDRAYATESENTAWNLAHNAQNNTYRQRVKMADGTYRGPAPGRTRAYTVEPNEQMDVGSYHPDSEDFEYENLAEWTAPEFKVSGTIDIMPDRQGTLPINWNQFRKDPSAPPEWADPINHPDDNDIEWGHGGGEFRQQTMRNLDRHNLALSLATREDSDIKKDQGRLF